MGTEEPTRLERREMTTKGDIMATYSGSQTTNRDWSLIAGGALLLIVGAICVFWPGVSIVTVAIVVGCALIAACIFDFIVYFRTRGTAVHSGWTIVNAVLDLILGVLFLINPVIAAEVITIFAGWLLVCYGIFAIVMSVGLRKASDKWWLVLLNGIVSILCGILFFVSPAFFAIYLGAFIMVRGATMVSFGIAGTPYEIM